MRLTVLVTLATSLATSTVALAASHAINIAPVRAYVQKNLVDTKKNALKLDERLDPRSPGAGITPRAVKKATQTLRGMTSFNTGTQADNFVTKMGSQTLILTASTKAKQVGTVGGASVNAEQQFVLRTGKQGLVIARGTLDSVTGKLTFTRSHNGHSASTPSERNAAN